MNLKTFLTLTAFIYIPFGLAMLLFPNELFGFYGFELGSGGVVLGRVIGSAIIGMGIINFLAREVSPESKGLRAILIGNLIYHSLDFFIDLFPTMNGVLNAWSWSFVVLHFLLAIGFAYFLWKK